MRSIGVGMSGDMLGTAAGLLFEGHLASILVEVFAVGCLGASIAMDAFMNWATVGAPK